MPKVAFLFPGQGSQFVGMGKDLYENNATARGILDQFSDILPFMFEGPEETLKRTQYAQPAILAVSLAIWAAFDVRPDITAGHSLGEYAALAAAGAISVETAIKLVKERALCMEQAPSGTMAAILGLDQPRVEEAVAQTQAVIANYNTPEQFIISGEVSAVQAASERAKVLGGKVVMLPVGGAFHSPLMAEAARQFNAYLEMFHFEDAKIPVVTNVDAQATTDAKALQEKLGRQITGSVHWLETIRLMLDQGVDTFIEIGPGKVLAGMIKKIDRQATVYNALERIQTV